MTPCGVCEYKQLCRDLMLEGLTDLGVTEEGWLEWLKEEKEGE